MFASNTSQVSSDATYIEDVFSTYLYTIDSGGNTVPNGIDLTGKGGLVWLKNRSVSNNHILVNTVVGAGQYLKSNTTDANTALGGFSFGSSGFVAPPIGSNGELAASWTFRKQPKFFDVVTYTGSSSTQVINHSLGAEVGFMVIKRVSSGTGQWYAYHRSLTSGYLLKLNSTDAAANVASSLFYNVTSTSFTVDAGAYHTNAAGETYVAYLFAHNAGGFGLTGTDNVISCGSYTGNGSTNGPTVTLGYEPQWVMVKNATTGGYNWVIHDIMRGLPVDSSCQILLANSSLQELTNSANLSLTATGFNIVNSSASVNASGNTYIYIAIRRGPMRTPTSGTSVFQANTYTTNGTDNRLITTNTVVDLNILTSTTLQSSRTVADRLRGGDAGGLITNGTGAETTGYGLGLDTNVGYKVGTANYNPGGSPFGVVGWSFSRAPSFFDEVCATIGNNNTINHNLGVPPELMMVRPRNVAGDWQTYSAPTGVNKYLFLNSTIAATTQTGIWSTPTSTQVYLPGDYGSFNYVIYMFASCPGVSKVGSYTGTGSTQTINCGFTGGARFVLIKRTDSTGNWWLWDSTRGMVSGTDPRMPMNVDTVQSNANWVYTITGGFQIVTADASVNASGGSYIFLAIA